MIADNRIAENAGWDEALLHLELEALQADDFDLSLTGFDPDDLADLLAGEETDHQGQTDDDAAPEVPETPVSRPGDLWVLGPHRVLCGDATDPDSYATLLRDERAAMVFSDPPYGVNYANSAKDKLRGKHRPILNDNLGEGFEPFLKAALTPMLAHCTGRSTSPCPPASWIPCRRPSAPRADTGRRSSSGRRTPSPSGRSDYQRQYEPILYGWPEGAQRHWCGDRDQGDVWQIKKPARNDLHPTMKPVELVERAIRNSSRPGDRVLDPFGGSGTTLIAAEKSGRVARLMELDPRYVDVIVRRWQEWTGKPATREADGVAFDDSGGRLANETWEPDAYGRARDGDRSRSANGPLRVVLPGIARPCSGRAQAVQRLIGTADSGRVEPCCPKFSNGRSETSGAGRVHESCPVSGDAGTVGTQRPGTVARCRHIRTRG